MAGNSFGSIFRLTTFGESHGPVIGGVVDGCPPNLNLKISDIQKELDRRKPGLVKLASTRREEDSIEILSGVFEGKTTGTPVAFIIRNTDSRSEDYDYLKDTFRPSHADLSYYIKYGIRDHRGGGRASARETAARVAGGAIARLLLNEYGIRVTACTSGIGRIRLDLSDQMLDPRVIDGNDLRCPDKTVYQQMSDYLETIKKSGDSVGSEVYCRISGVPAGLGEPVFDKLQADLAKAMLSINASTGFEIGCGFRAVGMKGSEHNDPILSLSTPDVFGNRPALYGSNHAGGVNGGITNGQDIPIKVAFKPVSTIGIPQQTIDKQGKAVTLSGKGRHDTCIAPRAVAVVEAMACLVMADHLLRFKAGHK